MRRTQTRVTLDIIARGRMDFSFFLEFFLRPRVPLVVLDQYFVNTILEHWSNTTSGSQMPGEDERGVPC